jgi:hypothetical protein
MSYSSLPPELLTEIFTHAVPAFPTSDEKDYDERIRTLRSCSLVHSTWKDVAQELLGREVWLMGSVNSGIDEEMLRVKAEQLSRSTNKVFPKVLRVEGSIESVLRVTGDEMWQGVTYARNFGWKADMNVFARFPSAFSRYSCLHIRAT